jgi:hypothetical protein
VSGTDIAPPATAKQLRNSDSDFEITVAEYAYEEGRVIDAYPRSLRNESPLAFNPTGSRNPSFHIDPN